VVQSPKTKEQWLIEGINHYNTKCYAKSLTACEQALRLDPCFARAHYGRGLALLYIRRSRHFPLDSYEYHICDYPEEIMYEEALAACNRALLFTPVSERLYLAKIYATKGELLFCLDREEEASVILERAIVKLAGYCGKIRRIMLHKPEIAGLSTCFTSKTCDASLIRAMNLDIGMYSLEPFSTPDTSVKHFMAVKSVILKHFMAVLEDFCRESSKKSSIFG
jgi:tetratricopeptide (TPR) repeat protein